jgi:hypothetical protein
VADKLLHKFKTLNKRVKTLEFSTVVVRITIENPKLPFSATNSEPPIPNDSFH